MPSTYCARSWRDLFATAKFLFGTQFSSHNWAVGIVSSADSTTVTDSYCNKPRSQWISAIIKIIYSRFRNDGSQNNARQSEKIHESDCNCCVRNPKAYAQLSYDFSNRGSVLNEKMHFKQTSIIRRYWLSGNALASINVVALRQTRLVLGWVTVCGRVNHFGM